MKWGNMWEIRDKILANIKATVAGLQERDEVVKLAYLALMSNESIFLLGPPGVGKSLIARRMKHSLEDSSHFEYLMNRFSTPEEIFGPISIKELENDKYVRKVDGYLPTCKIGFLDEIWKASPAIQNTLLTIINEKVFRNGNEDIKVPLKLLISASNEMPQEEGLEALYDRFLFRYMVRPTVDENNFENLITAKGMNEFDENKFEKITIKEIEEVKKASQNINVSRTILSFIKQLRNELSKRSDNKDFYVSDRRWKKIISILRTNAYLSARSEVSMIDAPLIKHCIIYSPKDSNKVVEIFNQLFIDNLSTLINKESKEINDLISKSKLDFKQSFKYEQVQIMDKKDNENLYCFKWGQKHDNVWIPMNEKGEFILNENNRGEKTHCIHFTDKKRKKIGLNYWTSYWEQEQIDLEKMTAYGLPLKKVTEEYEVTSPDRLKEIKKDYESISTKIGVLRELVKKELNSLIKGESLFSNEQKYIFEKAKLDSLENIKNLKQDVSEQIKKIDKLLKKSEVSFAKD